MGSLIQLGNHAQFRNGAIFLTYPELLIQAFKTRVAADSGIFEAESCLKITLRNLNNIQ